MGAAPSAPHRGRDLLRATCLATAGVLLAATRVSGASSWTLAALACGLGLVGLGVVSLGRPRRWAPPAVYGFVLAGLLVPIAQGALLAGLPDALVAAAAALAALVAHRHEASDAPPVASGEQAVRLRHAVRYAPAILLAMLVAALPWAIAAWAPARWASALELAGAPGVALGLAAAAVLTFLWVLASAAVRRPLGNAPIAPLETPSQVPAEDA